MHLSSYLVTPKELDAALQPSSTSKSRIVPLCASWFLPNDPQKRTGISTFCAQRIPGARFFDLDAIKDQKSPYPHMLPSAVEFADAMGKLGITNEDTVVVYDTKELGIFSAPRVGWTLQAFGHKKVHVLNNFRLWVEEGYKTETGDLKEPEAVNYEVSDIGDSPPAVVDFDLVKTLVTGGGIMDSTLEIATVLDARPAGRFDGTDPEPRPGLPSGHMPKSKSVPFSDLLDPNTKALLPAEKLRQLFERKGIDTQKPVVSSCGTGVTAAVVDAALAEAGWDSEKRFLYDGSWTEWAQRVKEEDGLILKTGE